MKSDYTYEVVDGVLCIVDLDKGNTSVTNNIENVLEEIRDKFIDASISMPPLCIYRDSQQEWDGVEIDLDFKPRFYSLGMEKDRDMAIEKAKMRFVGRIKGVSL